MNLNWSAIGLKLEDELSLPDEVKLEMTEKTFFIHLAWIYCWTMIPLPPSSLSALPVFAGSDIL